MAVRSGKTAHRLTCLHCSADHSGSGLHSLFLISAFGKLRRSCSAKLSMLMKSSVIVVYCNLKGCRSKEFAVEAYTMDWVEVLKYSLHFIPWLSLASVTARKASLYIWIQTTIQKPFQHQL